MIALKKWGFGQSLHTQMRIEGADLDVGYSSLCQAGWESEQPERQAHLEVTATARLGMVRNVPILQLDQLSA